MALGRLSRLTTHIQQQGQHFLLIHPIRATTVSAASISRQLQQIQHAANRRHLTAAPGPNTGPLLSRRSDRELPSLESSTSKRTWLISAPIFLVLMLASATAIFNYQKQSSPIVASTLYALRTNPVAREILGDEIYFANRIPWIAGEMNQLHGRVDIKFWVKGNKSKARMRFRCVRVGGRGGEFTTLEWSLQPEGSEAISLLEDGNHHGGMPMDGEKLSGAIATPV